MTKRLYLMRHGQTVFNLGNHCQGWIDSPLTDKGIEQARESGRLMREQGFEFDHFLSSTSERASDTLEVVMRELYGEIRPYERLKGLKESSFGRYEHAPVDIVSPMLERQEDALVPFGAEPFELVGDRMLDTLAYVMRRPGFESVLAVSHRRSVRAFLTRVLGHRDLEADLPNCGVARFDFDEDAGFAYRGIVLRIEGASV